MELDPFGLIEARTIAGYATGCEIGYLYIRGGYPLATRRLQSAIEAARRRGYLGTDVMGEGVAFDIELRRGAGAYTCGGETGLLNSIEGYRGEPRNKPPFSSISGLFGKLTMINILEPSWSSTPRPTSPRCCAESRRYVSIYGLGHTALTAVQSAIMYGLLAAPGDDDTGRPRDPRPRGFDDPGGAARCRRRGPGRHPDAVLSPEPHSDQRMSGVRRGTRRLPGACPSCARKVEDGMQVLMTTERVRRSRRMVLEQLASSVDLSQAGVDVHRPPDGFTAETVAQLVKIDNDLYVRDYSRCIMYYKCVKACGTDAQFTFAITAAGRGFDTRIATGYNAELLNSACVYCGQMYRSRTARAARPDRIDVHGGEIACVGATVLRCLLSPNG
jgi:ferredoxin